MITMHQVSFQHTWNSGGPCGLKNPCWICTPLSGRCHWLASHVLSPKKEPVEETLDHGNGDSKREHNIQPQHSQCVRCAHSEFKTLVIKVAFHQPTTHTRYQTCICIMLKSRLASSTLYYIEMVWNGFTGSAKHTGYQTLSLSDMGTVTTFDPLEIERDTRPAEVGTQVPKANPAQIPSARIRQSRVSIAAFGH